MSDEIEEDQSRVPVVEALILDGSPLSTIKGKNRFSVPLYIKVAANKTLRPIGSRRQADFICQLVFEYPTYQEELDAKKAATNYDEFRQIHWIDQDKLSEWRVRRCLVKWDLHQKIPGLTKRLHRINNQLEDDSLELFMQLPPLVRKAITQRLWENLGSA